MNPIHESGFASLVVLFFATGPAALVSLIALILAWKRPKRAIAAVEITMLLASLVCILAAVVTAKLHASVDYWINTGGYGPPEMIRAQYGAEWHSSAHLTAWAGLVFTALPFVFSAFAFAIARKKNHEIATPSGMLMLAGIAIFVCLLAGIL